MSVALASLLFTIGSALGQGYFGQKKEVKSYQNSTKEALYKRENLIAQAKQAYADTKSTITTKYGENFYNTLYKNYISQNNLSGKTNVINNQKSDYMSVSYSALSSDSSENASDLAKMDKFDTNYTSTLSTGNAVDALFNALATSDTALAQQLQLNEEQIKTIISNSYDTQTQYGEQGRTKGLSLSKEYETSKLSGNSSLGTAEAKQASSGIRGTGTGNNLATLQQFENDLSDANYAFQLNDIINTYQTQMQNEQKSSSQKVSEQVANINITKRSEIENATLQMLQGFNNVNNYQSQANEQLQTANTANYYAQDQQSQWWDIFNWF